MDLNQKRVDGCFVALVSALTATILLPDALATNLVSLVAASGKESGSRSQLSNRDVQQLQQQIQQLAYAQGPKEPYYTGESANVSRLIESLMKGYDKRLRPNYKGDPVDVGITMYISSVSSISEVNMDFTLDFYFRQHWLDERLAFQNSDEDELCISNEMLDKIWWPDTFFANAKSARFHTATTKNAFLRIKPNGGITQSLRLTVTAMCTMNLQLFPMDVQTCPLEIESYAYSVKHISYRWKDGSANSVKIAKDMQLPQFEVVGYKLDTKMESLSTGNYSRLACHLWFARSLGYYIIQIYVPSSLIVVLSWVSFWLDRNAAPARVALGITTVLTLTTFISSTNASLPKISYLKSIDIYLVTCFVMVFAALLEYAAVSFIGNKPWKPKQSTKYLALQPTGGPADQAATMPIAGPGKCRIHGGPGGAPQQAGMHGVAVSEQRTNSNAVNFSSSDKPAGGTTNLGLQDNFEMTSGMQPRKLRSECDLRSTTSSGPAGSAPSTAGTFSKSSVDDIGNALGPPPMHQQQPQQHHHHHHQQQQQPSFQQAPMNQQTSASSKFPTPLPPQQLPLHPVKHEETKTKPPGPPPPNRNVQTANAIDRYSRVVFPLLFVLFIVCYWIVYVNISRSQIAMMDGYVHI